MRLGLCLLLGIAAGGCGRSTSPQSELASSAGRPASSEPSLNRTDYPVFPNADSGADPAVPAGQGGKGFTGEGWETNTGFELIGDPRAVKGGTLRSAGGDFPGTLRLVGPNTTTYGLLIWNKVYETLLGLHPTTLEYIPGLATHWKISPDRQTYWFRLDPRARWSDGQPVVAEDVVATWSFFMDKGLSDPPLPLMYGKFEKPVAESKYIVRVQTREDSWRNFLTFANSMHILPAHALKTTRGAAFIRDYNYRMLPGSGPYVTGEAGDVEKGKFIRLRRRQDYWASGDRRNIGTGNFDEIRTIVVRDRNLEFEMFKKGDTDYFWVSRAQMWEEELNFDAIQRGLIVKRRVWVHGASGPVGTALNTRRPPLDDLRVRKALRLLFHREQIISRLMYNAYTPRDSIYHGTMWENPGNEKIRYDPRQALALLAEAGYRDRDARGRLVKDGQPLEFEMLLYDKGRERYFTVFQEDLRKVGITLNIRLVTFETEVKLLDERQFDMAFIGYSGSLFPNPEATILSSLADQKNSSNLTGFKSRRVDELIAAYNRTYEIAGRVKIIREIDRLFTEQHHWVLEWSAPYARPLYWNRYGTPRGTLTRLGNGQDVWDLWWLDPAKERALAEALRDSTRRLEAGPVEDRHWDDFARAEETRQL